MNHHKSINKELVETLAKYSINFSFNDEIIDLTTDLDRSNEDEIVFYRIKDGIEYEKTFLSRLEKSKSRYVFINKEITTKTDFNIINLGDQFDKVQDELVELIYPLPQKKLIGITGTNGKTSVAFFVTQLALQRDMNVLTIGTLGLMINAKKVDYDLNATSPSRVILRRYLNRLSDQYDLCVCEVSSHALDQNRFQGVQFHAAAWTNLSQDHLDYHGSMEEYFNAKKKIINYIDTPLIIPEAAKELHVLKKAKKIKTLEFQEAPSFCHVEFNKINLSIARELVDSIYGEFDYDYSKLNPVPGRLNLINSKNKNVIIDFAHTPDALENILKGVKQSMPTKRVICLFGCGGDRDKTKRPLMGEVASSFSDFIYVTSDNPRTEDPNEIIKDILLGIKTSNYEVEVDRALAIKKAIDKMGPDDVLLVAGKGHEEYIEINGKKHPYSDKETVHKALGI